MTLADAMAKHPRVFEPLYTNMVAAGETGGILDIILQRLSTYLEKMVKLKSDVKSAMIYPIAVIVISIIVISIIMIVVIPAFKNIFEGLLGPGEKLPWLTEIVVTISQFMAGYWWLIALVVGIAVFAGKAWYKTDKGLHVIDSDNLEAADTGRHHAKDRRLAVQPNAFNAVKLRRAHTRITRHHRANRRKHNRVGSD